MKYCTKCGAQNDDKAVYCASCGTAIQDSKYGQASAKPEVHESQSIDNNMPPKPANHLVWAILTTLLCCLPAGIVSIVFSTKVDSHYNQGDYDAAVKASKNAATWAIVSASVGVVVSLAYVVIMLAMGEL